MIISYILIFLIIISLIIIYKDNQKEKKTIALNNKCRHDFFQIYKSIMADIEKIKTRNKELNLIFENINLKIYEYNG